VEEFEQAQRAMWDAGDYCALSPYIADVGERLVARAGAEAGMRVLDVACGTGNAAIPAARAGATVTGLDLVPKLLEGGRDKAAAAGVEVDWVEGDAEALPFEDRSFDRVFSTFGHMFAPRHQRTADEMARVTQPGRRHRGLLLDAGRQCGRRVPGERLVRPPVAGLCLNADPLGYRGPRLRDVRRRCNGFRV
jgi:SAM-dependent methyltransferase